MPEHERVHRRLRDMILYGELHPGQAVTLQGLCQTTGAGMTPVREALRRLVAEGALRMHGNRRVSVPELTAEELEELAFARLALEPELARRGAERAGTAEIAALAEIDGALDAAIAAGDVRGYLRENHRFHRTLYALSGASVLLSLADALWLRAGPMLRVVTGRVGTGTLTDRHEEALAALRAGDPDAVAAAIDADLRQGLRLVQAEAVAQGNLIKSV